MSLDKPAAPVPVEITEGTVSSRASVVAVQRRPATGTELRRPLTAHLASRFSDEAALYDRQIRLWGLEAQQCEVKVLMIVGGRGRMRNTMILVVNLRGVATETIRNIVLAGIGKLVIWDREDRSGSNKPGKRRQGEGLI
ncbi:hypothetical protein F5148DRAFT_1280128 [Russula earlei]|uniref:Uncharacterized protein n=1 Tax=Russula earlei TaxID=71964 RepID=A0ACC0UKA4_9AGAM|nr:hypothetical protein F5148DRAFT_1280128 [Russula earlei]